MKKLIPFEVEGGQIFIEAGDDDASDSGVQRVGRADGEAVTGDKRFNEAIARVKPAAEAVLRTFREINTPAEIGLEFGIKFNAKVGAVFASADSEATFKVSLKWKNKTAG